MAKTYAQLIKFLEWEGFLWGYFKDKCEMAGKYRRFTYLIYRKATSLTESVHTKVNMFADMATSLGPQDFQDYRQWKVRKTKQFVRKSGRFLRMFGYLCAELCLLHEVCTF